MPTTESSSELSDLRRRNLRRVAHLVRDNPGVHLSDVSERTGLALGAVSSLVNALVEAEVIDDAAASAGGRGRPRRTLALVDRGVDLLAARITRSAIDVRSATLAGRIVRSESRTSAIPWSIDAAAATLAELARTVVGDRPPGSRQPSMVISYPGAAIGDRIGANELDWNLLPLRQLLAPLRTAGFRRASVGNDGSLATLGEKRVGAARGYANAAVVLLGRGLGGSAIIDGKLLRGSRNAPGFGHTPVDPSGPLCICGLHGCVELYASLQSIAARLGDADRLAGMPSAAYSAELDQRAATGEERVSSAIDDTRTRLRDFSDLLGALLAPEAVILTGSASPLARHLISEPRNPVGPVMIEGELGADAALVGAMFAAQDDALDDPLAFAGDRSGGAAGNDAAE
ncbi:ROK family transcriptional regulator [Leifsonia shinshuensis]|uniref:ROK family transcriptional regulator n=1 Tax=Leifsonia shinshuensis TaxID=150026 RepID=UPI001F509359|nr:ROK family transcriptional regulator [Leifsonia shinshuensis]MCI0158050.1 ROK family transcriptional regulator [Leifsonia shinshuensis]